ncbi:MAG: ORF6N domain-containing protein [Nanoarchaeota archaeon]|nr:ORF6N domain-containing protein [Nanoarchaeota archaeon]MBU1622343.1 ORF6N domain-containing protein [Nanoarchaeota archaeon]
MKNGLIISSDSIKNKIHTIRGVQVMLDSDLAVLYEVETRVLNQAVKRNVERFPKEFMFQLTDSEYNSLRSQIVTLDNKNLKSQIVTSSSNRGKHRKYLPFAFTEQGVAMLSGVLKSETAVKISIQIMRAFVSMRKFIASNAQLFQRIDRTEQKLLDHDNKFEQVFKLIEDKDIKPEKGIFFNGQIFDAYTFASDLIRSAKKSIILIDNYVDDSVLTLFSKREQDVKVIIYTKNMTKQLKLDLAKYNSQYPPINMKEFKESHDRFMIIDNKDVYHFGASLKDLGKKWFAFSKFDKEAFKLLERLEKK